MTIFQVNNFLCVMEVWIASNESNEENSEIHKTMTGSCSALKKALKAVELDGTLKQDEKHSLQNGARN